MVAKQKYLKLLVVEDNPGDFVLIEEYLSENFENPDIIHVSTYADAQKILEQKNHFDIILLDLSLPDLSGEKLVKEMVQISGQIPLIVLTGYENEDFGLKTLSMGVVDYLLKDEISPFMLGKVIAYSIERNRINQSLQKSERKYRDIFNLSPQPMFLIDVNKRTIRDVNEAAVQQYGYTKEEFIGLHLKDIRPSKDYSNFESEIDKIDKSLSQFYHTTVRHQKKNGEVFDVELSTSDITLDGKAMRMALAEDVTEKLKAEHQIKQKSDLLAANAKVTGGLIKNENWLEELDSTLKIIGKAVDVDRVYYFENSIHSETGEILTSQRIEWTSDGAEPQLDNPALQNIPMSEFPEIFPVLSKNEVFQTLVKDLPQSAFRELLETQNIISLLHFPIFVDGEFHGFIGFDDCTRERVWSNEEVQYLQTLGSNIANAIKIRNTTGELRVNEYKFKSMVEEGGDVIEIMDRHGNFKFISPNLEKILGWETDELLGKSSFDYVHPDDIESAKSDFGKLLKTNRIEARPFRFKNKNGKWNWLKCNATNLLDDQIINGILVTATDITEQKYYNELQRLERDVLEKNALKKHSIKDIAHDFLLGIEQLHSGFKTSVSLVKNNKIENFSSPSFPSSFVDDVDGIEIKENAGSCGAAIFNKKPIIVSDIYESPYWKGFEYLGDKYGFSAAWSQPIFNNKGDVKASFAVFYDKPSEPTEYEYNTVERAAHILRILFDSEEKDKAEKELALREQRFKALVQEGSDLVSIMDEDFIFTYISPSIGPMYESFVGIKSIDLIHPEDVKRVKKALQQFPNEKRLILSPYRIRDHEGTYYWVETIITNLLDEPAVEGYVANSRNVTRQIEREDKLKELSLVASKTTDVVIITEYTGVITWVNSAFEKLTGYTLEEVKGQKPGDFLQGSDTNPETVQKLSRAIENRESIEATILNYDKSGESYWLNMSIDPIFDEEGQCTHFIAIERDVTDKIKREKELQESLERYDIVNKATSDTIWDLDIKTDQMLYNDNIYTMFGYQKKQVEDVASWWREKIHPDDTHIVNKVLSEVLKNGTERFQMEYRFQDASGSYRYIFDRAFVIKDKNGSPVRMIGAMQDITQEREEEERLKLLESVITNTSESVVILNAKPGEYGREIIFANQAFMKLTGYSEKEVLGKTLHFLNGPDTDEKVRAKLRKAMDNYKPLEVEFINYKKDGEKFWINTSMIPVQNNKDEFTHWVAIGRDITDQKQNEKAIKSSLSEKETLLAEIHHRVKNNLAVVSGMMQLQAFESDNEDLQEKLYDSVVRIKTMATVHELLYQSNSFSKLEFSDTLMKLVENISETLQPDHDIDLDIHCDPITLNINQAIPASLIVNEVITNAFKHAFKDQESGKITFSLKEVNDQVNIEISDNGAGIPEGRLEQGGSLGIHLINVLCDQINGTGEYKNTGNGTTFTLSFEKQETKKGIGNAAFD